MDWITKIFKFLNENLGVVTFVVGFAAIYLYIKQRKDRKRDAASLILQEIRYAEQQIRNAKRTTPPTYFLASKLLPTNNWNDNIHLFIKDLNETEIDTISAFYAKATYIDSLIVERSKQKINPTLVQSFPSSPQQSDSVTAQPFLPGGVVPQQVTQQQVIQMVQVPTLGEHVTIQILADVSSSVEFLYNTPAVEKLRKISERKWYQPVYLHQVP
jgi:hypothetical protein